MGDRSSVRTSVRQETASLYGALLGDETLFMNILTYVYLYLIDTAIWFTLFINGFMNVLLTHLVV